MVYKTQFELLENYRAHTDQLENQLKDLGHNVPNKIRPTIELALQKLREFRDSLWAIDKALEKAR